MKKTIYFLLICFTGIMFSCSEDEGISKHEDVHEKPYNGYKRSIVDFQEMKSKLSLSNGQALSLFSNLSNKGGDDYIQTIDSSHIIQYSNDTLTTYTMGVSTLDDENYSYSNLIIRLMDGETEEFIAHYSPTDEWQQAHNNGEYLPYEGTLYVTDTDGVSILDNNEEDTQGKPASECHFELEAEHVECTGNSNTCPCTDGNGVTNYRIILVCSGSGGGGGNPSGGGGGSGGWDGEGFGQDPGIPTDPSGGNTQYSAFEIDFMTSLTQAQIDWLIANPLIFSEIFTYLEAYGQPNPNGWYDNYEAVQFATELTIFLVQEDGIKDNLRQAIANGITTTAEYTHKIFKKFSQWSSQYPSSITLINSILSGIKYGISDLVDTNPNTCTFADLFNMWLFELGSNPLSINGLKITTNQLKNQEGVNQARAKAMIKIQTGNISVPVNHGWTYGQGEFYDGMQNGNFVTAFLGSYSTNITIIQLSNGYQLNFHVANTSSWDSATRFRIDNNGDGYHDGIFPNTYRNINTDIGLGGNFTQNWYWTEIVN